MGVSDAAFSSWVMAISIAAGLTSIALSLMTRAPIVTAWSAPGTVLLISVGAGMPFSDVVGAFVLSALVILALGVTGLFDRLVAAIPKPVASGMMAGILFGFGLKAMGAMATAPAIFAVLVAAYLVFSVLLPRYAVVIMLILGLLLAWLVEDVPMGDVRATFASPVLTWPSFSVQAMAGLALPLILTTLTGQFLPGMAILRANGFQVAARPIVVLCALASLPSGLFGGITTALASITLALCAALDAHRDPARRYAAGVACGVVFCRGAARRDYRAAADAAASRRDRVAGGPRAAGRDPEKPDRHAVPGRLVPRRPAGRAACLSGHDLGRVADGHRLGLLGGSSASPPWGWPHG